MKKILLILSSIVLTGCHQEPKYSEQEMNLIKREARSVLDKSSQLIDSLEDVKNGIVVETKYDLFYQITATASINSTNDYKDSLYVAINEAEPNYESIKGIVEVWKFHNINVNDMLETAEAEADIIKN